MSELPVVLIFLFNRPSHTRNLFESIITNQNSNLFEYVVYVDGPRNIVDQPYVLEVVEIVQEYSSKLKINLIRRDKNVGLANSVISGVSETLNSSEMVIVLEDDLIVHPVFFEYMTHSLNYYQTHSDIFAISGYQPFELQNSGNKLGTYLAPRIHSWGWGTWAGRWLQANWSNEVVLHFIQDPKWVNHFNSGGADLLPMLYDQIHNKINSWAIRFNLSAAREQKFTVYPRSTLVLNRGFDGTGVHCGENPVIQLQSFEDPIRTYQGFNFANTSEEKLILKFRNFYS